MKERNAVIGFVSLGCPKNLVDTEVMLSKAAQAGYTITAEESQADIVIINTCAFIESAKREAIDNILDIAWLKEHAHCKGIIVTGCLPQRYGEQVLKELPEVDAILGVGSIDNIVECIESVEQKIPFARCDEVCSMHLGGDRLLTTPDYFAYLKISEGCDNCCSYCAIPSIRGKLHSRPIEELVREAQDLEQLGCKELTLIAQDTTVYGQDLYGERRLVPLIQAICKGTQIPWIRLLYCYPDKIDDALIAEFLGNPRLLPYIDLPVQHLSDSVLRRMNRHGDYNTIQNAVRRLRTVPDMVIRTTFLVGFPGETQQEFTQLCERAKEMAFDHVGVFSYSREEGTPAYDLPDQIDAQTKQDRADLLMREQGEQSAELLRHLVGKTLTVLCEGYDPVAECYVGRSARDAYEIDGKVVFHTDGKKPEPGDFVRVLIQQTLDYDLVGILV